MTLALAVAGEYHCRPSQTLNLTLIGLSLSARYSSSASSVLNSSSHLTPLWTNSLPILSLVYCLLSIAHCLLSIVYCLLPMDHCLLSIVYYLLAIIYCLLSTVFNFLLCLSQERISLHHWISMFTVCYCLLSDVYCPLPTV